MAAIGVLCSQLCFIYMHQGLDFQIKLNKLEEVTGFYVQQMVFVTHFGESWKFYTGSCWAILASYPKNWLRKVQKEDKWNVLSKLKNKSEMAQNI